MMRHKTLFQLFIVDFVIFLTGTGLLPLLPLYAQEFGADATGAGIYLAITYAAITSGTLLTARLARLLGFRKLFIVAGIMGIPALAALGMAENLWLLVVLTAIIWFSGGIGIALVSIYVGMVAGNKNRGKSFGLTYLSLPLASLVAGFTVGRLVEWQGYPFTFGILALAWALWPLFAATGLSHWPSLNSATKPVNNIQGQGGMGRSFIFLLVATLLSTTTIYLLRLTTSMAMDSLKFSPSAISGTAAIGGLVTIPLTYTVGTLSDHYGRKIFLVGGYLLGSLGALVLVKSGQLWHFWLAAALVSMSLNVISTVSPALVVDLLPSELRSRGLPYLNAMRNFAGIIGFAGGGLLLDKTGTMTLYFIAATLSIGASLVLIMVHSNTFTSLAQGLKRNRTAHNTDLSLTPAKS